MADIPPMSPHKAEACARLSHMGQRLFRFIEFDDEEKLLAEIRKHPVGLFFIIVMGIFISLVVAVAIVTLALNLNFIGIEIGDDLLIREILIGLGLMLGSFGLVATLIAAILYRSDVVFVTDQKIAEVVYISLFNRRILQLGMGNVQDVTVSQKGILPRLFNFGGLVVETAGES